MKVSVLMITYNQERFIAQAVESALMQQTKFAYEIVVGEDCSTDRTREVLIDLQKRYPTRIRLLFPDTNIGMHRNLVQTLEACRGEYIALLEGDDYWSSPDKLQKQADFLDRHPECAICFHASTVVYEEGQRKPWKHPVGDQKTISTLDDLLASNFMQTGAVMFRRGLVTAFPDWFYTLRMADWPLHILNAQHGNIGYIDEVMSVYRIHVGGVWSVQNQATFLQEAIKLMGYLNKYFNFRYDKRIRAVISMFHCGIAAFYEQHGYLKQARSHIVQSVIVWPFYREIRQKQLTLLLRLYAPWLYKLLRNVRSGGQRSSVRADQENVFPW